MVVAGFSKTPVSMHQTIWLHFLGNRNLKAFLTFLAFNIFSDISIAIPNFDLVVPDLYPFDINIDLSVLLPASSQYSCCLYHNYAIFYDLLLSHYWSYVVFTDALN
jgi:hypothetical protein